MHLKLTAVRGFSFPARNKPLSVRLLCSERNWKEQRFQLKYRYVASLMLYAIIAEITSTAIVFILCVACFILSDDGSIINV